MATPQLTAVAATSVKRKERAEESDDEGSDVVSGQ